MTSPLGKDFRVESTYVDRSRGLSQQTDALNHLINSSDTKVQQEKKPEAPRGDLKDKVFGTFLQGSGLAIGGVGVALCIGLSPLIIPGAITGALIGQHLDDLDRIEKGMSQEMGKTSKREMGALIGAFGIPGIISLGSSIFKAGSKLKEKTEKDNNVNAQTLFETNFFEETVNEQTKIGKKVEVVKKEEQVEKQEVEKTRQKEEIVNKDVEKSEESSFDVDALPHMLFEEDELRDKKQMTFQEIHQLAMNYKKERINIGDEIDKISNALYGLTKKETTKDQLKMKHEELKNHTQNIVNALNNAYPNDMNEREVKFVKNKFLNYIAEEKNPQIKEIKQKALDRVIFPEIDRRLKNSEFQGFENAEDLKEFYRKKPDNIQQQPFKGTLDEYVEQFFKTPEETQSQQIEEKVHPESQEMQPKIDEDYIREFFGTEKVSIPASTGEVTIENFFETPKEIFTANIMGAVMKAHDEINADNEYQIEEKLYNFIDDQLLSKEANNSTLTQLKGFLERSDPLMMSDGTNILEEIGHRIDAKLQELKDQ